MGQRELIESLKRAGEEKTQALREEAEAEAARVEAECAGRIAALGERYARRREELTAAATGSLLARAEKRGALLRLEAENALVKRLYALARALLFELGEGGRAALFEALVQELPPCRWESVRVSPADLQPARALFPRARVETDAGISGGVEAVADGGRVRVDNTLEKRLERQWPQLVPSLVAAALKEG